MPSRVPTRCGICCFRPRSYCPTCSRCDSTSSRRRWCGRAARCACCPNRDRADCPQSITTLQEKLALLEAAGVEHAIVLRFDRALASLGPQEFIEMLGSRMDINHWVIGFDFAFGNQRRGNAVWLHEHGHEV